MKIYRSGILTRLSELFLTQNATEPIPSNTGNICQPVVEVGQRTSTLIKYGAGATNASVIFHTTSAKYQTFLTAIHTTVTKDVTCDMTACYLEFKIPDGTTMYLHIPVQTLTAESRAIDLAFPYPVELLKGSTVRLVSSAYAAGSANRTGMIFGYELE